MKRVHSSSFEQLMFNILRMDCTLDGKHVVFGQVIEGMSVVRAIERQGTTDGTPKSRVIISDCGELKKEEEPTEVSLLETSILKKADTRKSLASGSNSSTESPKKNVDTTRALMFSGLSEKVSEKVSEKEVIEMLSGYKLAELSPVWILGRGSGLALVEFVSTEEAEKLEQDVINATLKLPCEVHHIENAKKKQGVKRVKQDAVNSDDDDEEQSNEYESKQKKVKTEQTEVDDKDLQKAKKILSLWKQSKQKQQ